MEVRRAGSVLTHYVLTANDVDRFKMLQEQQTLILRDFDDLTKRHRDLNERFTTVDIKYNRVTEDLTTANGYLDQLRNECANLRAEKRIWEVSISYHYCDVEA